MLTATQAIVCNTLKTAKVYRVRQSKTPQHKNRNFLKMRNIFVPNFAPLFNTTSLLFHAVFT